MILAAISLAATHSWSLVLGGDLMLNQIPVKYRPLATIAPFLRSANLAVANLESPLTTKKVCTPRKSAAELKARSQYLLKADPAFTAQIADAGIRMVSVGNNHCMDYNGEGLAEMRSALDRSKVVYAGAGSNVNDAAKIGVFTLPDGRRIPVAMKGGGAGSGTNVVVNVDASGSQVQGDAGKGEQLGRVISQAVQQELIRQRRPGGLLTA